MKMKRVAQFLTVALLIFGVGMAEGSGSQLPWGMTWDTSLTEYTQIIGSQYPEAKLTIRPLHSNQYIVTYHDRKASVPFEAIFSVAGGVDCKVKEYKLADLAEKALQLESVGIVIRLTERPEKRHAEMMDEFYETYQPYAAEFGAGDVALSYIIASKTMEDTAYYQAPAVNGSIDLDRIKTYCNDQLASLLFYSVYLRNEHAQYRLDVHQLVGVSSTDKKVVGQISLLFTRKSQTPLSEKTARFP